MNKLKPNENQNWLMTLAFMTIIFIPITAIAIYIVLFVTSLDGYSIGTFQELPFSAIAAKVIIITGVILFFLSATKVIPRTFLMIAPLMQVIATLLMLGQ